MYGALNAVKIDDGQEYQGFKVSIINPPKVAVVRLPTPDEIAVYLNAYQDLAKASKNGQKRSEEAQRQADIALFKKIRLDAGEAFDAFESEHVVARLTSCSVVFCERNGDTYVVTLKTPFGEVVHTMRGLTLRELSTYRTALNRGSQDWRGNTILSLFDTVSRRNEGYLEGVEVPPHHKSQAMSEMALAVMSVDPVETDPNS